MTPFSNRISYQVMQRENLIREDLSRTLHERENQLEKLMQRQVTVCLCKCFFLFSFFKKPLRQSSAISLSIF